MVANEVLSPVCKPIGLGKEGVLKTTGVVLSARTGQEYWRFDAQELSVPLVTEGNGVLEITEADRSAFLTEYSPRNFRLKQESKQGRCKKK